MDAFTGSREKISGPLKKLFFHKTLDTYEIFDNFLKNGPLAQLVEHRPFKPGVAGSNPARLIFKNTMLRYLTEEEKKALFSIAEKKDYQEGEIIFSEGDKNKEMYIIEKGKVKVFLEREGEEIELSTFSEGEFFGEMALFTGRERTASIKAIKPTTLLIFKRKDMERLIEEHPKIGAKVLFAVIEEISERLARTNEEFETYYLIHRALRENPGFREMFLKMIKKNGGGR